MLEGLVVMGKIERSGKIYHSVGVTIEKKSRASGNSSDVHYPDWVETEREKVNFLLSDDAPLLDRSKAFVWYEDIEPATGKVIYDALHTASKKYEYTLRPNPATNHNEIQFHEVRSAFNGISFKITENGTYLVRWQSKPSGIRDEKEFKEYDDLRKWILQNL